MEVLEIIFERLRESVSEKVREEIYLDILSLNVSNEIDWEDFLEIDPVFDATYRHFTDDEDEDDEEE